jgi:hypothetical protein
MEIVTLLSMQGATQFKNFIEMNSWTHNFFPPRINSRYSITEIKRGFARKFFEKIFKLLKNKEDRLKCKWPWKYIGDYYIISLQKKL